MAEKVKLGRFLIERLSADAEIDKYTAAERVRMSFEELGPTFVKLGQLLATRPDLVPADYVREFEKLHDRVQPLPFETIEGVLKAEFGEDLTRVFASVDPQPLGSASIAQVHRAKLATGEDVVVKVQRPGILQTINDDLSVLYMLADLLERYVAETRPYDPVAIVDEFFKTLELETNFVVEANNIRRFQKNFQTDPQVKIPHVHLELTTEKVLVMEALQGVPLSQEDSLRGGTDPREIIRVGLKAYFKMVFIDGLFHGDLHAGNFFVLPGNRVGLIDFGVVGRLNARAQNAVASMLVALAKEDYERLAFEYVDLAPFSEKVNVDLFARDLRDLIAPYYGLTLRSVNIGRILMTSASIAATHGLTVPTELMMFFKSIVSIEGLGRRIDKDFDFLQYSLEFANELVQRQLDPQRMMNDLMAVARESRSFLSALPRQLNYLVRRLNSPDHAHRLELRGLEDFKKSFESSFNLLFLGVIIASLVLSASHIFTVPTANVIAGMPSLAFILYVIAAILGLLAFKNYIKK